MGDGGGEYTMGVEGPIVGGGDRGLLGVEAPLPKTDPGLVSRPQGPWVAGRWISQESSFPSVSWERRRNTTRLVVRKGRCSEVSSM